MKTINCKKCREKREQDLHKLEYNFFRNTLDTAVCGTTAAVISILEKRGRSPQYIRQMFEDIKMLYDMPKFNGKGIDMLQMMEHQKEKYGLDYDTLKCHAETEKEFIKGIKEAEKENKHE